MKARVIATGEIVEVELANTYRFNDGSFVEVFIDLKANTLYFGGDLDFDIEGKFAKNCLNGIKQGIVHDPDYWTRLEHQAAIAAMQGILSCSEWNIVPREGVSHAQECALQAQEFAHALVEKINELVEEVNRLKEKFGEK